MDWVLHDGTANMANHIHDLLLVVINCLGAARLSFFHSMVRRGNLRSQHLLNWMMVYWLHLQIRRRYCKVAQLGELAWTEYRLCLHLLLLLLRLDTILLLL